MSKSSAGEPPSTAETKPVELERGSFGAWLRQQREARDVSLREIADASKISLRYLEALELDRFESLPAPVFARGFLREYARVVGLNPDEVVNLFLIAAGHQVDAARARDAARPARSTARASAAPSPVGYGLLLGLAVVAFLGVAAYLSYYAEKHRAATGPENRLVAPSVAVPADGSSGDPATQAASRAEAAPGTLLPGAAEAPASAAPAPGESATVPAAREAPLRVVLNFSEDCWVESVIDGKRRTSELRAGGETVHLDAEDAVLLTLGNARAVAVEVNGRPFPLPANATRVVRDLRIDRTTVAAPPAVARP